MTGIVGIVAAGVLVVVTFEYGIRHLHPACRSVSGRLVAKRGPAARLGVVVLEGTSVNRYFCLVLVICDGDSSAKSLVFTIVINVISFENRIMNCQGAIAFVADGTAEVAVALDNS